MARALRGYRVVGLVNNIPFLKRVLDHPSIRSGDYDTGFIPKHEAELLRKSKLRDEDLLAGIAVHLSRQPEGMPG